VDVAPLLAHPALEALTFFVVAMAVFGMVVPWMLSILQVARLLLYGASRVLGQPLGFLMPACFSKFLDFTLPVMSKAFQLLMFVMALPFLLVDVAHSLFHDSFGFPFQFPGLLVTTGFGQFLDFACPFLRPVLQALFAVMLALAMVICPFPLVFALPFAVVVMCPLGFTAAHFLGPNTAYLVAHFLCFLVFSLLLEGFDLAAFLIDPFAKLTVYFFGSFTIAFPSFSFFSD